MIYFSKHTLCIECSREERICLSLFITLKIWETIHGYTLLSDFSFNMTIKIYSSIEFYAPKDSLKGSFSANQST